MKNEQTGILFYVYRVAVLLHLHIKKKILVFLLTAAFGQTLYCQSHLTSSDKNHQSTSLVLNDHPIDRFHSRDKNLDNRCYAAILVYRM